MLPKTEEFRARAIASQFGLQASILLNLTLKECVIAPNISQLQPKIKGVAV